MGVLLTICLSWPQTAILSILAFQVARIIGVSHKQLARSANSSFKYTCNPSYSGGGDKEDHHRRPTLAGEEKLPHLNQ
jgi:hypothetical protein